MLSMFTIFELAKEATEASCQNHLTHPSDAVLLWKRFCTNIFCNINQKHVIYIYTYTELCQDGCHNSSNLNKLQQQLPTICTIFSLRESSVARRYENKIGCTYIIVTVTTYSRNLQLRSNVIWLLHSSWHHQALRLPNAEEKLSIHKG